ncbi:YciI family protein [Chitinimonas lacunae]|uniref:YciI family protein n=1 Tax=Chitinimonas lacunae TaxID=1963018 RepID=A0ABV8MRL4_9NEIS
MEYLYLIRPVRPDMLRNGLTAAEEAVMAAHFDYLSQALQDGRLILAGRTLEVDERGFGIAVFRADDQAAAQAFAAADPAVAAGVVSVEVYPYRVALLAPALPEVRT